MATLPTLTLPNVKQPFFEKDGVTITRPWRAFFDSLQNIATQNAGTVTHTGSLTADHLILGNGLADIRALTVTGTAHDVLHGAAAGDPTFSPVDLAADVTGDLPYANLTPATGASKVFVRGSAAGAGDWQEGTLGAGLALTGTVLSATAGGTVTTTGSPASGNLTKFSGATSITNGDLSGDVTTSSTLATTIAAHAVTDGKLRQSSADSVIGRSANSTGDVADISASANQQILVRRSSTLGFTRIDAVGYWSPLTDGIIASPSLVFSLGDTISIWTDL